MSRSFIAAAAALAWLAGCSPPKAPLAPAAPQAEVAPGNAAPDPGGEAGPDAQRRITVLAHAIFVDVCVRHLGEPGPLLQRAGERNLELIQRDVPTGSASAERAQLYGIRSSGGRLLIGMMTNAEADNCMILVMQPEASLALTLASDIALVWTRGGARVTPMAIPSQRSAGPRMFYRVQSTGNAARRPASDWAFGFTLTAGGAGIFQALLPPRGRPGAPQTPREIRPQPFVPRGILRNAGFDPRPVATHPAFLASLLPR